MNKQVKTKNGVVVSRGIGWCDFTSNPCRGCFHECKWRMPNGEIAECYAKGVAEGIARAAFPDGFAHSYNLNITEFDKWMAHKEPARIFLDSMADVTGAWVSDDDIRTILIWVRQAQQHTFQLLTKNAPRLLKFKDEFPPNLWIGVSTPPDFFMGKELSQKQKEAMLRVSLKTLSQLTKNTTFLSAEPLSWDIASILEECSEAIDWLIIGAASHGRIKYQPSPEHVNNLLDVCDCNNIRVYMKSNLVWGVKREEFPQ